MDARKQKRLGPAPIASFEKSFEDNASAPHTSAGHVAGAAAHGSTNHDDTDAKDINRNGNLMEPHDGHAKTTITATIITTTTTITTNNSRDASQRHQQQHHQQLEQQPASSISSAIATTSTTTATAPGNVKSKTDGNFKRPPPLKAANVATTLFSSSGEQQLTYRGATTLPTPSTPRIELSRASSSSHHEEDSRDSSPENVFEQVGTGTLQETIGAGFREEGALELRTSTEELYFMDPKQKKEEQEKMQQQQQQQQQQPKRSSPHIFKFEDHQSYLQQHQRKDSASSEVAALLCISGRTSRISSVGSQGSAVSHLSAVSGISRSPSPHRMLLETSFCGPKPLDNMVDGRVSNLVEQSTVELLEQVLLARKHDPTQAVLAEGIKVESSPKRKPPNSLSNGDANMTAKIAAQNRPLAVNTAMKPTMGAQRRSTKSPGQMVVGKTPGGTEYIRINLKPDHMYDDKGIAPNERVVEAPNTLAPVFAKSQKKPVSLSLGRNVMDETRLTPTASPKPSRHGAMSKDTHGSRSPSPAAVSVSRKSSFSSLFRFGGGGKDSPDSPRERSRSRSKSKDRQAPPSQNVTPSKQKSVLAIFKPGKRGSSAGTDPKSSMSSSPIDGHELQLQQQRSKTHTPTVSMGGSRPASRLRYYDEPVEGYIHIPLHTPPEEKETRQLLQGIQQLNAEPVRPAAAITASQLAAAAAALKPVGSRKGSSSGVTVPRPQQLQKLQRIENLDAIHTLPHDDEKELTWSLEVNLASSQETVGSESSYASGTRVCARSQLANVKEYEVQENGIAAEAEIHRLPSQDSTTSTGEGGAHITETTVMMKEHVALIQKEAALAKERRRILFATRLGSGSQEQIFSTQFSISKTESQSSQLSEQVQETIPESPTSDNLQRQNTVIRRSEDEAEGSVTPATPPAAFKDPVKRVSSIEAAAQRQKSVSTSEDEKSIKQTTVAAVVVLRRKESSDELRHKSHSTSEDDTEVTIGTNMSTQRHSRYLENFDVRKRYHENIPRKPKRQSISEASRGETIQKDMLDKFTAPRHEPTLPQPPPPSTAPSPSPPPPVGTPSPTVPRSRSQSQSPVSGARRTPTKPPRTTTPTRRSQTPPTPSASAAGTPRPPKKPTHTDRQSVHSTDEPVESSESERDSDLAAGSSAAVDPKRRHLPRHVGAIEDHESTGLVSQESFDDELPYIPTTLPEERAQGIALIPMKERANMELKTCPVDRPRSTTPLNPSHLEEYYGIMAPQEPTFELSGSVPVRGEKLRISLPRKDSAKEKVQSTKSPRRPSNSSGKTWFEFAEEGLRANMERKDSSKQLLPQNEDTKPKAQSKAVATAAQTAPSKHTPQRKLSGHWIDFENIPEKRKPPKRITTLPKEGSANVRGNHVAAATTTTAHHHHHHHGHHFHQSQPDVTAITGNGDGYNYVKPEDCQCECHEVERESSGAGAAAATKPLTNVDLLQQGEDMLPLLDTHDGIEPSDSSRDLSCYTDDEMDMPMRYSGSSRSKSSSSKLDEFPRRDVSHSPRNRKFPDNRK